MLARTAWSSSAPSVLERLLAVGGFGEQHPRAGPRLNGLSIANVAPCFAAAHSANVFNSAQNLDRWL